MSQRKPTISVRRPPRADVEAFVAGGDVRGDPTSGRPNLQVVEQLDVRQADGPDVESPSAPSVEVTEAPVAQALEAAGSSQTAEQPDESVAPPATATSSAAEAAETSAAGRTGIVTRADGRTRRRRTVYLPPALDKQLAVYCTINEVEVSDFVAQALEAALVGARS